MYDRVASKVIIDAGHGGTDPGAVNGNIYEKDFNLQASQYIYNRLRELGIPAEITRTSDIFLPKNERIAKIDSLGVDPNTILISNHINSGGGQGAEVIYALRNNSNLANMILDNIGSAGQIKRRVYQRRLPEDPSKDYYYIIRETTPAQSVLIEYGFIDNENDLRRLQNNLDSYAEGVVKTIADYTNTPYKAPGVGDQESGDGYYTVVKGDTLWSIANRFGLTVDELRQLNNLTSDTLSIGQRLLVRFVNSGVGEVYTVQKGDSLWSISRKYNITVNDLINYNNLSTLTLQIGQQLLIPSTESSDDMNDNDNLNYTVQSGDTLWSIANRFGLTVDELINYNNLSTTTLQIGQQLLIPNNNLDNDTGDNLYYTVQSGDTLWSIAKKYNIMVDDLIDANNLTSTLLKLNQVLVIPK